MKSIIASFLFLNLSAHAAVSTHLIPKVIYGTDDRMDIYQSSDTLLKELARSTAAQIQREVFSEDGTGFTLHGVTMEESGMCKTERFSNQKTAANCSGFLIAPDVLVTAGHCVTSESSCNQNYWVFDYANANAEVTDFKFNEDQVFYCTQIIERKKDPYSQNDYAVVRLNRSVPNRTPLKVRTTGKIADNATVAVIGHPTGLPVKITSNAVLRDNSNTIFFRMNSDTYGGNSGSAVVDMATGLVEGILVRGDTDYSKGENSCYSSVIRDEAGGRGEDATRITNLRFKN